jgi:hypothetical protein
MLPHFRPMSSGFTSGSVQSGQMPYSWRSPSGMAPAGGIVPAYRPGVPAAERGAFREEVGANAADAPFAAGNTGPATGPAGPAGASGFGFSAPSGPDVAGALGSIASGALGAGGLAGPVGAAVGYAAGNSAEKAAGQGIGSLAGFAVAGPIGSALFGYIGGKTGEFFENPHMFDRMSPAPTAPQFVDPSLQVVSDILALQQAVPDPTLQPDAPNDGAGWGGGDDNSGNWSAGGDWGSDDSGGSSWA